MNISSELLDFALEKGMVLFSVLTAAYLLSLKANPDIWRLEYKGRPSQKEPRGARAVVFVVMGCILTAALVLADIELMEIAPEYPQTNLFIVNLMIFTVYNLLDLLVVDFLLHTKLKPDFMEIPDDGGSKEMVNHVGIFFRNYLYAGVLSFTASLLATLV